MITNIKKRDDKKKGFTLIELVAVMAIIGILAAIMIPKLTGYMKEAKKTKVIDQCRKVVMAVETYNLDNKHRIANDDTVTEALSNNDIKDLIGDVNLPNLDDASTIDECYRIVQGADFKIDDENDKLIPSSVTGEAESSEKSEENPENKKVSEE